MAGLNIVPHTYTKHQPGTPPTTNAERIRRYRKRQKENGKVRISTLYLTHEALDALAPLCQNYRYPPTNIPRGLELSSFLNERAKDIATALLPKAKPRRRK
ncbi:hypothetical protein [Methylomagnum sp.]